MKKILFFLLVLYNFSVVCMEHYHDQEDMLHESEVSETDSDTSENDPIIRVIAQQMIECNKSCDCGFSTAHVKALEDHLNCCDEFLKKDSDCLSYETARLSDDMHIDQSAAKRKRANQYNTSPRKKRKDEEHTQYMCICGYQAKNESCLHDHIEKDHKKMTGGLHFCCPEKGCENKRFLSPVFAARHYAKKHPKIDSVAESVTETQCSEQVLSREEKTALVENSKCMEPKITKCMCRFQAKNYDHLINHVSERHKKIIDKKKRFECTVPGCKAKLMESPQTAVQHYRLHTGETTKQKCPFPNCLASFARPAGLSRHLKTEHNLYYDSRTKTAKNDAILDQNNLVSLGNTEAGGRKSSKDNDAGVSNVPLSDKEKIDLITKSKCMAPQLTKCMCGYQAENYSTLRIHIKDNHYKKINERFVYVCTVPGCKRPLIMSPEPFNAARHYRLHTKEDVCYRCPLPSCLKNYQSVEALRLHFKEDHNLKYDNRLHRIVGSIHIPPVPLVPAPTGALLGIRANSAAHERNNAIDVTADDCLQQSEQAINKVWILDDQTKITDTQPAEKESHELTKVKMEQVIDLTDVGDRVIKKPSELDQMIDELATVCATNQKSCYCGFTDINKTGWKAHIMRHLIIGQSSYDTSIREQVELMINNHEPCMCGFAHDNKKILQLHLMSHIY